MKTNLTQLLTTSKLPLETMGKTEVTATTINGSVSFTTLLRSQQTSEESQSDAMRQVSSPCESIWTWMACLLSALVRDSLYGSCSMYQLVNNYLTMEVFCQITIEEGERGVTGESVPTVLRDTESSHTILLNSKGPVGTRKPRCRRGGSSWPQAVLGHLPRVLLQQLGSSTRIQLGRNL